MKKFLMALAAVTTVAASPAFAQAAQAAPASNLTFDVNAKVSSVCGAYRSTGPTVTVAFNDLTSLLSSQSRIVTAGSVTYRCNSPAGFTRTITSANSGKLVRDSSNGDASNSIPYQMFHGGIVGGISFDPISLSSAKTDTFSGLPEFLVGAGGRIYFNVSGVADVTTDANNGSGTTVYAGNYTDTVTISVAAL